MESRGEFRGWRDACLASSFNFIFLFFCWWFFILVLAFTFANSSTFPSFHPLSWTFPSLLGLLFHFCPQPPPPLVPLRLHFCYVKVAINPKVPQLQMFLLPFYHLKTSSPLLYPHQPLGSEISALNISICYVQISNGNLASSSDRKIEKYYKLKCIHKLNGKWNICVCGLKTYALDLLGLLICQRIFNYKSCVDTKRGGKNIWSSV